MLNTSSKITHTAKHGANPSNSTILRMVLATLGFIGMVLFGFLMHISLAPIRESADGRVDNGFNSFGDMLLIPAFLFSVYLCAFGVYELYKVYRQLNDPKNYGKRSRRATRTRQ